MNDRNDVSFNNGEEEEFHITDDDIDRELAAMEEENTIAGSDDDLAEVSAKPSESKRRSSALKHLKRKHWIVIAIVILVLLIGLLKMVGNKSPANDFEQIVPAAATANKSVIKKNQTDLIQMPQQQQASSSVSEKSDLIVSPAAISAPVSSSSTPTDLTRAQLQSDMSSMANVESKLTQTLQVIQQQNVQLTQQLVEMNGRVQTLESAFNQSNQAVEGLAQQVVQLQSNPLNAKKPQSEKKFIPTPAVDDEKPQYTVEAVVPQRAWLQTAEGNTVTVMVGDSLPGLGAVATIDPYSGNVTMSSGKVLKYAA